MPSWHENQHIHKLSSGTRSDTICGTTCWSPIRLVWQVSWRRKSLCRLFMWPFHDDGLAACRYSLYAVLNHSGQTNSGHYTAFIRSGPGCWCLCDDQKIVPVTLERVLTTDAYVLLYHKNFLASNSPSPTPSASSAVAPSASWAAK